MGHKHDSQRSRFDAVLAAQRTRKAKAAKEAEAAGRAHDPPPQQNPQLKGKLRP